jgi:hypothetical protein
LTQAQTEALRGEPQLKLGLERIKQAKTPEEIAKLQAETYRAVMAGDLDAAQAGQINNLLDLKMTAQRLGNEKLEQEINNKLELELPGVGTAKFDPDVLARVLGGIEEAGMRGGGDTLSREKYTTQQEQTAVDIDTIIQTDPESKEALARYQDFNRYTNRPKVAYNDDGEIKFIDLPKVGGRVVTGKMLAEAAEKVGLTVDDLARAANYSGPQMFMILKQLGEKAKAGGK